MCVDVRPAGVKALAPDGKDFVELAETAVPGDELFIHKYLKVFKLFAIAFLLFIGAWLHSFVTFHT